MKPAALIFDVDGTLTETAELHRNAFNTAFRDAGLNWHWSASVYARLNGIVDDQTKLECFVDEISASDLEDRTDRNVLINLVAQKSRIYRRLIETDIARLRPGVARLIREAKNARLPMAIASTLARQDFEHLLQNNLEINVDRWFQSIVTREKLGATPTAFSAYSCAVSELKIDPTTCVAFDDSGAGTDAAKRNGLNVIAVPGIYSSSDDFSRADLVISDLGHPAAPFQIIRGDAAGFHFVSLDALKCWYPQQERAAA
jgi:HAD superfamily hydrolase (TIGR01509 family)